jgi:hypothetical protein
MRGGKIIVSLIAASAIGCTAFLFVARLVRCDEIIEPPVRSPDGQSFATSTFRACPVGLLSTTTCSVSVALNLKSAAFPSNNQTSIFESTDASEVPTLTWVNGHELALRVNDIGEIQLSKREVGGVRISYTVPKWIWDRLGKFEADRLRVENESQNLYRSGKLSKEDLRASIATENSVAEEHAKFRQWVLANATVDDQPQ